MSDKPKSWLWPDHTISKAESRLLRVEHNRVINLNAQMAEALREVLTADLPSSNGTLEQRRNKALETCRAALRAAGVE